jgi:channel protein (hemolysin III family)
VLKRLDHAAIFVLIAGSFTPVHAILFRRAWRWGMLAGISCHWAFILGIAPGEQKRAGLPDADRALL